MSGRGGVPDAIAAKGRYILAKLPFCGTPVRGNSEISTCIEHEDSTCERPLSFGGSLRRSPYWGPCPDRGRSYDAADQPRPNVLLIMSDDLNNSLGCYGQERMKTPHLGPTGPARRAFRAGLLPVSVVWTESQFAAVRALSQQHGDPDQWADLPPDDSAASQPVAGVSTRGLFRRSHRQAVSLQRAEFDRHEWARRSRLMGTGTEPGWLRPAVGRARYLLVDARQLRGQLELVRVAARGPAAHRRLVGRGCRVGFGALCARSQSAVLPGRGILSAAHALCVSGAVLRTLSERRDAVGDGDRRRSKRPAASGTGQRQEGTGRNNRRAATESHPGLLRQHQLHGRTSGASGGRIRSTRSVRQHDHRLHQRSWISPRRTWTVAEDESV